MRLYLRSAIAVALGTIISTAANAQLYWDVDTISQAGAGGATPSGTWDVGITPNWNINADGSGVPGVWTDFSDAVFAAGTDATGSYTVTLAGTVNANSIAVEEGNVTVTGGTSLDLGGTAGIDVATGTSLAVGAVMGGFSQIAKNGAGRLDLTAANTFGGMSINAGTVRVNDNLALGAASSGVVLNDGITLSATGTTARALTYGYGVGGNFTLGQSSGGTGALTLAGTMDLVGAVRTITVNNAADTISAVISSTGGGIIKEGTGTLTLSGANTYTGQNTINQGILAVTSAAGLGTGGTGGGSTTITAGATLQVSGGITIPERIEINGTGSTGSNGALRKTGNNTTALSGQLTGSGSIIATAGTLRFTQTSSGGSNSGFTGPITASGGATIRFEFISPNQLGLNNVITLDNGTLRNDNTVVPGNGSMISSTQPIVLGAGGGTLNYEAFDVGTNTAGLSIINAASVISGTGGLTKTGLGSIGVAAPCTYGGPTIVNGGYLKVRTTSERFPNGTALTVNAGGTFDLDGLTETVGSVDGVGTVEINAGQFNVGGNNASTTFAGQFTGTNGKVTKQGTGTLTLTGASVQTGLTTVSAGTLLVNNTTGSGTGTGPVTVAAAGKLGGTGTVAGPITNNGTLVPGDGVAVGALHTGSDVISGASSHWAIELSGSASDQVLIGGNLDLSAVDNLDITGSGTGPWVIATYAGSLTGTFNNVTAGYTVDYATPGQIILSTGAAPLLGDYNNNGTVDAGDYAVWRKNGANAALPNDGGAADQAARFTLWRQNFGKPPGAGSGVELSGASVPEPSTMALLLIGLVGFATRRRG